MATEPASQPSSQARRRFLTKLGLGALVVSAPTLSLVSLQAADQPVTAARRWGLLIDTAKCASGCDDCVRGCNAEHGIAASNREDTTAQWIRKIDLQDNLTGRESSLPVMCQHCSSAPCVDVCPTGASFRRADGIVLVNKHTCIGCRYCMMACPYKARSFIHENLTDQLPRAPRGKGTVESCTLCVHRIDAAEDTSEVNTACAQACTDAGHDAIVFGDLNDPDSQIAQALASSDSLQIRSDLQLGTGVRYSQF
jgi:molybdopterin-containing oxidoreductase family iron-sulfur binding subunit